MRFFGGYHRKALVERHHIKPISTNVHSLQIKRTSEWNKASEELKRYQELHEKYKDKPEFLTDQYGDPFDGEKVGGQSRVPALRTFHRNQVVILILMYFRLVS